MKIQPLNHPENFIHLCSHRIFSEICSNQTEFVTEAIKISNDYSKWCKNSFSKELGIIFLGYRGECMNLVDWHEEKKKIGSKILCHEDTYIVWKLWKEFYHTTWEYTNQFSSFLKARIYHGMKVFAIEFFNFSNRKSLRCVM